MLRSIPPKTGITESRKRIIPKISFNLGSSSFGNIRRSGNDNSENFSAKKGKKMGMHDYQKMGVKTLEKLLVDGYNWKKEMILAVQKLPSDENQNKLEKLGFIIERLKQQIESRG